MNKHVTTNYLDKTAHTMYICIMYMQPFSYSKSLFTMIIFLSKSLTAIEIVAV